MCRCAPAVELLWSRRLGRRRRVCYWSSCPTCLNVVWKSAAVLFSLCLSLLYPPNWNLEVLFATTHVTTTTTGCFLLHSVPTKLDGTSLLCSCKVQPVCLHKYLCKCITQSDKEQRSHGKIWVSGIALTFFGLWWCIYIINYTVLKRVHSADLSVVFTLLIYF